MPGAVAIAETVDVAGGAHTDRSYIRVGVTIGGVECFSNVAQMVYAAPVVIAALDDQSFTTGTGLQSIDTAEAFTGDDLSYAGTAITGATINAATGVVSVPTASAASGTVVVSAPNSGGQASTVFEITITEHVETRLVMTIETLVPNETFTLPFGNAAASYYDAVVDMGDGNGAFSISTYNDANLATTYATPGPHTPHVSGGRPTGWRNNCPAAKGVPKAFAIPGVGMAQATATTPCQNICFDRGWFFDKHKITRDHERVISVQSFLNTRWVPASALILFGGLALALPDQFVARAFELSKAPGANISLIYGFGFAMIATGLAVFAEQGEPYSGPRLWVFVPVVLCTLLYFMALTQVLQDWWIDDAGITFAYSRSLADGFGLVAQPWLPPEEGYSSSVWMLLLSGMARLGADIPLAAKYLGLGLSVTCMIVCAWILTRETRSPLAVLVCCIGIASGPTVTWAASGQEHALQALLLLTVVVCAYLLDNWRWPAALALMVLVLTRPEAPIIVIAVFLAAVFLTRRAGGPFINAADAAVALLPFLAFVGLVSFRYFYFGDLLPNPYYAKSSGTSLTGLANPLGGGWAYILAGLRDTAVLVVLPLAFLIRIKPLPDWIVVAGAVLAGHLFFVIWAKGDWMGQYRFLMPILPVALLLTSLGLQGVQALAARRIFGIVAMLILTHTAIMQLASFSARPTTPMAVVTKVGNAFRALADRLEIDDPMLAHHDAGGIAYHRMIRLVDLGGLVNRTIGKNMENKKFLTTYLLDDLQPDFVFGAYNFAAASGFSNTEAFAKDYVRLEFTGLPFMRSDLSYIRRDRVVPAPGIGLLYDDATGALLQVQVHDPES